ncbi:hypothetical protein BSKO_06285 [Bryopsis sp. KO-2023]|nr:hypothetical protein BSKO_06285 [Bryopsis sp. KO-2023]
MSRRSARGMVPPMNDDKRLLRSVVRRVHPDLFAGLPKERTRNSESLKLLNSYLDDLSHHLIPEPASLEFWVKDDDSLKLISVELTSSGTLSPLFFAFDLISEDDFMANEKETSHSTKDLLEWLRATVDKAVQAADQHYALKARINEVRALLEEKYQLSEIQFGHEFGVSNKEQERQLESLNVLDQGLEDACESEQLFCGLNFCVYHPESCPLNVLTFQPSQNPGQMRLSRVADDGRIHVVADAALIKEALMTVEVDRARLLSRLSTYWIRRARALSQSIEDLLRVEDVLCDTSASENAQKFVLWAGYILDQRNAITTLLKDRQLSFSLLVHSDENAPMIDHMAATSILQVRSDCPPQVVLDFLSSDACRTASQGAKEIKASGGEEEAVLEKVRVALGAKQVIRVCSMYERDKVIEAAERLLENADSIRMFVDLSNACIAIDDCYQMWESGFLSIPYDFQIHELRQQFQKMLTSGDNGTLDGGGGVSWDSIPPNAELSVRDVSSGAFRRAQRRKLVFIGGLRKSKYRLGCCKALMCNHKRIAFRGMLAPSVSVHSQMFRFL